MSNTKPKSRVFRYKHLSYKYVTWDVVALCLGLSRDMLVALKSFSLDADVADVDFYSPHPPAPPPFRRCFPNQILLVGPQVRVRN